MFWLLVHSVDRHKNPLDIRQLIVRRYLHYSKYLFALVRTVHLTKKGKKYIPAFLFAAVWMGANFHLLKRMFISAYSSQPALWKAGQEFNNQTSHLFGTANENAGMHFLIFFVKCTVSTRANKYLL